MWLSAFWDAPSTSATDEGDFLRGLSGIVDAVERGDAQRAAKVVVAYAERAEQIIRRSPPAR
jgi:DNA-binding GntR family transcriptional regulator